MKIRFKILSGFLILVAMLIIAGTFSIIEFSKISSSEGALLEDNYKSIDAAKEMLESLEREDSGILLLLLGHWDAGRKTVESADSTFLSAVDIVSNNLTEIDEEKYVEKIKTDYKNYKTIWEQHIAGTLREGNINWYFNDVHPSFLQLKTSIKKLMTLNQTSMYQEATNLKNKAKRAIMPGIVAIVSSLVFLFVFIFFINYYLISPIDRITKKVENYYPSSPHFESTIETKDELKRMETAIQELIQRIKK